MSYLYNMKNKIKIENFEKMFILQIILKMACAYGRLVDLKSLILFSFKLFHS